MTSGGAAKTVTSKVAGYLMPLRIDSSSIGLPGFFGAAKRTTPVGIVAARAAMIKKLRKRDFMRYLSGGLGQRSKPILLAQWVVEGHGDRRRGRFLLIFRRCAGT